MLCAFRLAESMVCSREQSDPMTSRLILIPLLSLMIAASAVNAWAQDKGTVNPKPLPPLANPNDPNTPAKELFGRKALPAAMPTQFSFWTSQAVMPGRSTTTYM